MVKKRIISFVFFVSISIFLVYSQNYDIREDRKATYYHHKFVNRRTSSGEIFIQTKYTAAHKSLPLNTFVRVTNNKNKRSIIVRINDRCPKTRVIDLTLIAAKRLNMIESGVIPVRLEILNKDYSELWEKQDEIFNLFDRTEEIDSLKNAIYDSIIFNASSNLYEKFIFAYNISLIKSINKNQARKIIRQLPNKYKGMTRVIKSDDSKYYTIRIGPFISMNSAYLAVKELRSKFPFAHILKNKYAY